MYYGTIKNCDVANGEGVRVSLFVSGCTNHCEECFQPETWDFCYGEPFTAETEDMILRFLEPSYMNGLTVLGGEPFEPKNQKELLPFLQKVKRTYPQKNIWVFSGFTWEELTDEKAYPHCPETKEILKQIDVLVDGRYQKEMRNLMLKFRGSSNQRLIDVPKTLAQKNIVLWAE